MTDSFLEWLKSDPHPAFWQQPLAAEKLDRILSDPKMKSSIAGSWRNQSLYHFIDLQIANDYAHLIDSKLRAAVALLSLEDFKNPEWFTRKEKANMRQSNYFLVRNYFSHLIKKDIIQHQHPDAKLSAFRRWIHISQILLTHHCYEGFLLVFTDLQTLETPQLVKGLPQPLLTLYNQLRQLSDPIKNYAALNAYVKQNKQEGDFIPLFLWFRQITMLEESLQNIKNSTTQLKEKMRSLSQEKVCSEKELIESVAVRKRTDSQLQAMPGMVENLKGQKVTILGSIRDIKQALMVNQRQLPGHLELAYKKVVISYNTETLRQGKQNNEDTLRRPRSSPIEKTSKLYSRHLLPSFWANPFLSTNEYWDRVYGANCSLK
jgi:hypothetical protein